MGYFTGINSLWRTSGLFLGALGHDLLGFSKTFVGIGILSLISLPLIRMSQRRSKASGEEVAPVSGKGRHGIFFCLGAVMGLVGGGMITSTLGLVLKAKFGDSFAFAGIVVGAATLTGFVMSMRHLIDGLVGPVLGAVADRVGRSRSIGTLFLLGSGLLVLLGVQENMTVLIVVITAYFICATALYTVLYAQSGQSGSRAVASFATAMDLGMSIGPMIGWGIAQFSLPLSSIFMIAALVYAVGAAVSFGMLGRSPRGACSP
jgi:MFS family permease